MYPLLSSSKAAAHLSRYRANLCVGINQGETRPCSVLLGDDVGKCSPPGIDGFMRGLSGRCMCTDEDTSHEGRVDLHNNISWVSGQDSEVVSTEDVSSGCKWKVFGEP